MKFRPCIDLHGGRVKQIVGSSLTDDGKTLKTNYDSQLPPEYYADLYYRDGLKGGHVIMLGPGNEQAARQALAAHPGFLQVGGGITADNAAAWLDAGAQKVIVTSCLFTSDGMFLMPRLKELAEKVSRERLVVDLSCRQESDGLYHVAINRWQTITDVVLNDALFRQLGDFCGEFLIHAVNVEGRQQGIDGGLVEVMGRFSQNGFLLMTYAGGIASLEDIQEIRRVGQGHVDFTIGSALDIFGGHLKYDDVVRLCAICG